MRVNRPLLTLVTLLCLFSNIVFSQSSIFHDAEELSEYLEEDKSLHVHFKTSGKSQATIEIKLFKSDTIIDIKPFANRKFKFTSFGYYELTVENWGEKDSIYVSIADSVYSVFGQSASINIYNEPNSWEAEIISEVSETDLGDGMSSILGGELSYYFGEKKGESDAIKKVINILSAHSNFRKKNYKTPISIQNLQYEYSTNPFFKNLTTSSPLLNPNIDQFLRQDFYYSIQSQFDSTYASNYKWDKLLYGDSILQLQKNVSFQDASTSYRNRIVTSQRVLSVENKKINDTNKNRNLLDAKTVAVGLSDFIAERAQEELNLTFFNRFKKNLNKKSELTILFPNTKKLLYQFKISDYKVLLTHARTAFEVDLENLGLHFPDVLNLPKYKEKLNNSPDVFNLALIYSIANLAYRDVPVESILISSYKKLEERKIELGKSINLRLASTFVNPENAKEKIKEKIKKEIELEQLKKYTKEYIEAIEHHENLTYGKLESLYKENDSRNEIYSVNDSLRYNKTYLDLQQKQKALDDELINVTNNINADFYPMIEIQNRKINNESFLVFHKNTTLNYLNKKDYFGYIIDDPRKEDFNIFFNKPPDNEDEILAKGLEGCNNLLAGNHYEKNKKILEKTKGFLKTSRAIKTGILSLKEKNQSKEYQIKEFFKKAQLLSFSIERELKFWKSVKNLDDTDHYITGLNYLASYIMSSPNTTPLVNLWFTMQDEEQLPMDSIILKFHKPLKEKLPQTLNLAFITLDSIDKNFQKQVENLNKAYGNAPINNVQYQFYSNESNFHIDSMIMAEEITDTKEYNEADFVFEEQHLIETLTTNIREQNQLLQNATTDEERKNIDDTKRILNDKRDLLITKKDSLLNIEIANFNKQISNEGEHFNNHITKIRADYQNSLSLNLPTKPIKEFYSLKDNSFHQKYSSFQTSLETENSSKYVWYHDLEKDLIFYTQTLDTLKKKEKQLQNHLNKLENRYCNELVKAQDNAQNLSKGIELSAQLLFAFRDYDKMIQPLYSNDTSVIAVTVNEIDKLSGLVKKTYSVDSLRIDTSMIKGTDRAIVAARWITKNQFKKLRENDVQWNIFLGLLYQRLRSIDDAPNFSAEGVALLATKFLDIAHDMDTHRNELRRKKNSNDDTSFKDYYPFIRSTVDLFNTVLTTPSFGDTSTLSNKYNLQNIPRISNEALSLYENIYIKEYGNAVLNTMELLKIISAKKISGSDRKESERAINAVLTYGTFMANMINAKSSDQVKIILQSATLPPGSSRVKRETVSSFTINSYLGLGAGRDRLINVPNNIDITKDALGASLSVPIGFTYSFTPKKWNRPSSFSFHVPLIDLGAITAYRQNPNNDNYSIDNLPDFSWSNLFSPGLFFVYNVGNSPFSAGFGGQYGPQLREIKLNTGEAVNVNSWRFPMIFVSVDVPFFNLHTGARRIMIND